MPQKSVYNEIIMNSSIWIAVVFVVIITIAIVAATMSSMPKIPEGASVSCADGTGEVYRYTGGKLRHYPNPSIAASWNPSWANNIINLAAKDCRRIAKGVDMSLKS